MPGVPRRRAGGRSNFWLVFRRVARRRQATRVRSHAQGRAAVDPETPPRAPGSPRPVADGIPPKPWYGNVFGHIGPETRPGG